MIRTATNLILMILICFTLTAIPINRNLLAFDLSKFIIHSNINQTTEYDGASFSYILDEKDLVLFNPMDLLFEIKIDDTVKPLEWNEKPELVLEVLNSNGVSRIVPSSEFVVFSEPNDLDSPTMFSYNIDLAQSNLDLDNGTYSFKLYSDHKLLENSDPINLSVSYFEDISYSSGLSLNQANSPYLILYFTDITNKHIVPIARKISSTNKVFRTTVNGLLVPPKENLGLSVDLIAPKISMIQYSNGLVSCYLKSNDLSTFNDDSIKASNAIESMTNTIMDIQTPYAINKIQFLVDKQPSNVFFNGTDLTAPIARNNNPRVYLGLKTNNQRTLLTYKNIAKQPLPQLIPELIGILKTGTVPNIDSENLMAVLPNQVELIDYKLEGVTLKLNFDSSLKDVYADTDGLSYLMLDSLSSTFASIDGVDNIELHVNGKTITSIGNVSFSSPITPPKYINIEE